MMTAYLLAFLLAQTHRPAAELEPWADAMAGVCQGKRGCLREAATAVLESAFAPWVVDGSCQDPAWRRAHPRLPTCDGGRAVGPWQVHDAPSHPSLVGATPALQASGVWEMMQRHPESWATHKRAWALADAWLAGHL